MLNVGTRTLSKTISNKLRTVLPTLISLTQTANVKKTGLLQRLVD